MPNTFFCSDHHFSHGNILKYQPDSRGMFSNVDEMNEAIIERHNERVKTGDEVYFLGDFAFVKTSEDVHKFLRRMNGKKYFVLGNHDKHFTQSDIVRSHFVWVRNYFELKIKELKGGPIVLFHFPIERWNRCQWGQIHLHGHCHGHMQEKNKDIRRMDVGLDCNNLYPYELTEVIETLKNGKF